MGLDVDNLLASMAREGRVDSSGAFTIDLATAQAKLAKFTLPDSRAYILKMVQAAVAGRATELHLYSRTIAVEVRIVGLELEQDGLELLLFKLAESGKSLPRATYHLAVAIRGALGLESKEIRIVSRDGKVEKRVLWAVDGISHEVVHCDLPAETIITFTRTNRRYWTELFQNLGFRGLNRLFLNSRDGLDEEQRLVNDICCQAPLLITINGARVPRLEALPNPPTYDWRRTDSPYVKELLFPISFSDGRGFLTPFNAVSPVLMERPPGQEGMRWRDFECYQLIGLHPGVQETQLMVILDGVLIKRTAMAGLGYTAVLSGCGLTTDLTGFQVVENEIFEQRCQQIQALALQIYDQEGWL